MKAVFWSSTESAVKPSRISSSTEAGLGERLSVEPCDMRVEPWAPLIGEFVAPFASEDFLPPEEMLLFLKKEDYFVFERFRGLFYVARY